LPCLASRRIASALDYPTRPVHIIVGFPAGGTPDLLARLIGEWLSERLGQSFVIENRPGAATNIATELVMRAAPDGCTLLLVASPNVTNVTLYPDLKFNFIRDITPVASIGGILSSWWSTHHFRPRPFPSSSLMPKPILVKST
jgi:tripartite-type tricarboxylate transporter receptor subunit TctC